MQVIEYRCDVCGWEFQKMSNGGADDQAPACPACGSQEIHVKIPVGNEPDGDDLAAKTCSHGVFT